MTASPATGSGGEPARRLRSPRVARERIRRAAREIAAAPATWEAVVNRVRVELGRPKLPPSSLATPPPSFLRSEVDGEPASLPLESLEPLAGGGMNTVSRSADLFAGRPVVVRRHLPAESAVEEAARRERNALVRERLAVLPRHPVIQRYWASGSVEDEACDVFDFAPGVSLGKYVSGHGFTYGAFLDAGYHAARGLLHLHRHGFVHGDVKPENLCVVERTGPSGRLSVLVSVIDFDIVSSPEEQLRQYALGNGLDGTLPYMPPENFRQDVPEDPDVGRRMVFSKDVFALGLTLVRLLNGRFPESFYTDVASLLQKKVDADELEFPLPGTLPRPMQDLLRAMCRSEWTERPSLSVVIRLLGNARRSATKEEREAIVAPPVEALAPRPAPAPPALELVGPYRLVNPAFAPRVSGDGQTMPLAELADPFGRRLVGVPFELGTRADEEAFYEERSAFLKDLNAVRLKHPELFPGSFRDLVRQEKGGRFLVWIVRPLLEGALDLTTYLRAERPGAPVRERIAVLRRVAEALSVLEEAGYTLARLTPELVFFVPLPAEGSSLSATKAALTRPIRRLFDVPAAEGERRYRQELMGTASAMRTSPEAPRRLVADLLEIADAIGVFSDLGPAEQSFLLQLATVETWRERVDILVWIEMQCP